MKTSIENEKLNKEEMIDNMMKCYPSANKEVISFIFDFSCREWHTMKEFEVLRVQFMAGYCYYFAVMLKATFNRGTICWCAPYSHIVWVDEDGTPYDIEGVNQSDCDYFIPTSYIEEAIVGFMHLRNQKFIATKEYINNAIERYKKDNQILYFKK